MLKNNYFKTLAIMGRIVRLNESITKDYVTAARAMGGVDVTPYARKMFKLRKIHRALFGCNLD